MFVVRPDITHPSITFTQPQQQQQQQLTQHLLSGTISTSSFVHFKPDLPHLGAEPLLPSPDLVYLNQTCHCISSTQPFALKLYRDTALLAWSSTSHVFKILQFADSAHSSASKTSASVTALSGSWSGSARRPPPPRSPWQRKRPTGKTIMSMGTNRKQIHGIPGLQSRARLRTTPTPPDELECQPRGLYPASTGEIHAQLQHC